MAELSVLSPQDLGISPCMPLPQRKDWRIGLVGFGGIAEAHASAYRNAGWRITAIADISPEARERGRQATGCTRVYPDYEDLIADSEVEQDAYFGSHPFYAQCPDFLTIQWNTHLADLLRFWTGRNPERVLARSGRMIAQNFRSDNLLLSGETLPAGSEKPQLGFSIHRSHGGSSSFH